MENSTNHVTKEAILCLGWQYLGRFHNLLWFRVKCLKLESIDLSWFALASLVPNLFFFRCHANIGVASLAWSTWSGDRSVAMCEPATHLNTASRSATQPRSIPSCLSDRMNIPIWSHLIPAHFISYLSTSIYRSTAIIYLPVFIYLSIIVDRSICRQYRCFWVRVRNIICLYM